MQEHDQHDARPAIQRETMPAHPRPWQIIPAEHQIHQRMAEHMHDHAPPADALPLRDFVGLQGKVGDEMRQDQAPENQHGLFGRDIKDPIPFLVRRVGGKVLRAVHIGFAHLILSDDCQNVKEFRTGLFILPVVKKMDALMIQR